MDIKKGDRIETPRFLTVKISEVFDDLNTAYEEGFREPTYYDDDPDYKILGKCIGENRMIFAAVKK